MSFLQQTHGDFVGTRRFSNWVGEAGRALATEAAAQREKKIPRISEETRRAVLEHPAQHQL